MVFQLRYVIVCVSVNLNTAMLKAKSKIFLVLFSGNVNGKSVSNCPGLLENETQAGSLKDSHAHPDAYNDCRQQILSSSPTRDTCLRDQRFKGNISTSRKHQQRRSMQKIKRSHLSRGAVRSMTENSVFSSASDMLDRTWARCDDHLNSGGFQSSIDSRSSDWKAGEKDGRFFDPYKMLINEGHTKASNSLESNVSKSSPFTSPSSSPATKKRLVNHQPCGSEKKEHENDSRFPQLDWNTSHESINFGVIKPRFHFTNNAGLPSRTVWNKMSSSEENLAIHPEFRQAPFHDRSASSTPRRSSRSQSQFSEARNRDYQMVGYVCNSPPQQSEPVNSKLVCTLSGIFNIFIFPAHFGPPAVVLRSTCKFLRMLCANKRVDLAEKSTFRSPGIITEEFSDPACDTISNRILW